MPVGLIGSCDSDFPFPFEFYLVSWCVDFFSFHSGLTVGVQGSWTLAFCWQSDLFPSSLSFREMENLAWQCVRSDVPDCIFLSVARDQRVGLDWPETSSCFSVGGVLLKSCPSAGQSSKGVAAHCCRAVLSGLLMPLSKMSQEESTCWFWNKFLSSGHLPRWLA